MRADRLPISCVLPALIAVGCGPAIDPATRTVDVTMKPDGAVSVVLGTSADDWSDRSCAIARASYEVSVNGIRLEALPVEETPLSDSGETRCTLPRFELPVGTDVAALASASSLTVEVSDSGDVAQVASGAPCGKRQLTLKSPATAVLHSGDRVELACVPTTDPLDLALLSVMLVTESGRSLGSVDGVALVDHVLSFTMPKVEEDTAASLSLAGRFGGAFLPQAAITRCENALSCRVFCATEVPGVPVTLSTH